jgi:hypothetical protein
MPVRSSQSPISGIRVSYVPVVVATLGGDSKPQVNIASPRRGDQIESGEKQTNEDACGNDVTYLFDRELKSVLRCSIFASDGSAKSEGGNVWRYCVADFLPSGFCLGKPHLNQERYRVLLLDVNAADEA